MENTEVLLTDKKENCISRIKAKWSERSKAFKIYYILLWALSIICFGICVWSLVFIEWTRQDFMNIVNPEYKKFIANPASITDPNAVKFFELLRDKYHGDVDKYSWLWGSRSDMYLVKDTYYTRLSSTCYILFVVFAFIWAPITVYCFASFLNVAFPYRSKKVRKAAKALKKEAAQANNKKSNSKASSAKTSKPSTPKLKKVNTHNKNISVDVNVAHNVPKDSTPPVRKRKGLKGDWMYYHEDHKIGKGGKK